MEPSFYSKQIERMRPQIAEEKDPATQREMRKTFRHLNREYRKATRHRHPWHGLKSNVIALVLVFFAVVLFCLIVEWVWGLRLATTAFAVAIAVLLFVAATIFLAMKRINPDTYTALVNTAVRILPWTGSRGEDGKAESTGSGKVLEGKPGRTLPTLRADTESKDGTRDEIQE
jgi:hypothetical protein